MLAQFHISTERLGSYSLVRCSGELDVTTRGRLDEVLALALDGKPSRLLFDGTQISILASPGIEALLELALVCRERDIELHLKLSDTARRMLDLVGLWWLGVVDDGPAVRDALAHALEAYSRLPLEAKREDIIDEKDRPRG